MADPILYVEDTPDDVFLMQRAFKKIAPNLDLQIITNGQAAADFFDPSKTGISEKPNLLLVILDLNLPGRSGLEILEVIRTKSRFPRVPVIIFSASNRQEDINACYQAGANAYVIKPNSSEELKNAVRLIYDFWLKLNQYSKESQGIVHVSA